MIVTESVPCQYSNTPSIKQLHFGFVILSGEIIIGNFLRTMNAQSEVDFRTKKMFALAFIKCEIKFDCTIKYTIHFSIGAKVEMCGNMQGSVPFTLHGERAESQFL